MIPRFLQKTCSSITMYPRCLPKYKLNYFVHINRQKLVFHFIYVLFSHYLSYVCECVRCCCFDVIIHCKFLNSVRKCKSVDRF